MMKALPYYHLLAESLYRAWSEFVDGHKCGTAYLSSLFQVARWDFEDLRYHHLIVILTFPQVPELVGILWGLRQVATQQNWNRFRKQVLSTTNIG